MSSYSEYANNVTRILEAQAAARAEGQRQAGNIWGSTLAGVGQMVANIPAQQLEAKRLAQESKLTDLKVAEATREAAKQQQLRDILTKHQGDFEAALPELSAVDPALGLDIGNRLNQSKKAALDFQASQFKAQKEQLDWLHEQIGAAVDPASYLQARHTVERALGADAVKDVPVEYNPEYVAAQNQAALTAKERLDAQIRAVDQERANLKMQADLANVAADNARADAAQRRAEAAQAETVRHNRVMENRPVGGAAMPPLPINTAPVDAGRPEPATANIPDKTTGLTPNALYQAAIEQLQTGRPLPRRYGQAAAQYNAQLTAVQNKIGAIAAAAGMDVPTLQAFYKANTSSLTQQQKFADAAQAFMSTADKNAKLLDSVLKKVPDLGAPIVNRPWRAFQQDVLGNQDMADFRTYLQSIRNEYAKIITNPNLAGQLTDQARGEAQNLLRDDASVGQILRSLTALRNEGTNRLVSVGEQIQHIQNRLPVGAAQTSPESFGPKEGDTKPIPGYPGTEQTYRGGKWIRTK